MRRPFREHHLLELLHSWDEAGGPLDRWINHYFRNHKALGSKDRAYVAETAYKMVRWRRLLDHFSKGGANWGGRLDALETLDLEKESENDTRPRAVSLSCPDALYDAIVNHHGKESAEQILKATNHTAPITVRVNPLKTTREKLLSKWKKAKFDVTPTTGSPFGISLQKREALFSLPEFKAGLFEMQDEASQLAAALIEAKPGEKVLDYCAGSGGKTLAFAHQMEEKGQIFLHDIRKGALKEAKIRLKRAGIENAQIIAADAKHLKSLKKKMDWVLVDAPCSGTGTYRRNPDMKWNFSMDLVHRLVGEQRKIFEHALSYLKPGGKIVYLTCSILNEENEAQIAHFKKAYNLEVVGTPFTSLPLKGEMDGFFGAVLSSKES